MGELYASGRIVDLVLAFLACEFIVVSALFLRTGRGIAPVDLGTNLLSAAFLLLAVRSAVTGQGWMWMAAFLLASFPAHLLDLGRRWNKPARSRRPGSETDIAPGREDR